MFLLINSAPKTAPIIAPIIIETKPNGFCGKDSNSAALLRINAPNPAPSIAPIMIIDTVLYSLSLAERRERRRYFLLPPIHFRLARERQPVMREHRLNVGIRRIQSYHITDHAVYPMAAISLAKSRLSAGKRVLPAVTPLAAAYVEASRRCDVAKTALRTLPKTPARDSLEALLDYVVRRRS